LASDLDSRYCRVGIHDRFTFHCLSTSRRRRRFVYLELCSAHPTLHILTTPHSPSLQSPICLALRSRNPRHLQHNPRYACPSSSSLSFDSHQSIHLARLTLHLYSPISTLPPPLPPNHPLNKSPRTLPHLHVATTPKSLPRRFNNTLLRPNPPRTHPLRNLFARRAIPILSPLSGSLHRHHQRSTHNGDTEKRPYHGAASTNTIAACRGPAPAHATTLALALDPWHVDTAAPHIQPEIFAPAISAVV
jgi:hypothetical protein